MEIVRAFSTRSFSLISTTSCSVPYLKMAEIIHTCPGGGQEKVIYVLWIFIVTVFRNNRSINSTKISTLSAWNQTDKLTCTAVLELHHCGSEQVIIVLLQATLSPNHSSLFYYEHIWECLNWFNLYLIRNSDVGWRILNCEDGRTFHT